MRYHHCCGMLILALLASWLFVAAVCAAAAPAPSAPTAQAANRPNILWITCEDMSPRLGCYGDRYAITPHIDRLAARGVRYTNAFAPIGVCAPARSSLILGMYAPSVGTHHMRCQGTLPEGVKCYSEHLRNAGYYCTNNVKTDYNFQHPKTAWDECSNKAHWKNRAAGQPFFAIFNITVTHESQVRVGEAVYRKNIARLKPEEIHDPAKAPIPPYHPDTPEVRRDWARLYDNITALDYRVGDLLKELEEAGLAEDTIVWFYSDHGDGMPRSKRWLYDSSLRVPLVIYFPKKFQHLAPGEPGSVCDRLVSFVDFGPTLLSLVGAPIPSNMQGKAFLGPQAAPPRQYVYGFRDRMDERYDMLRSVRDQRYLYIRNYMPHLPWFHTQHIGYMYEMPTMQVWQRLADEGKLTGPSAIFMAKHKPTEELYDCQADPYNIRNLADSPEHQDILQRMRKAHENWVLEIIDLGFLPEADLRSRFGSQPPYDAVRAQPESYPLRRIMEAAQLAGQRHAKLLPQLVKLLDDRDQTVRYWGATGLVALGQQAAPAADALLKSSADQSPSVRIAAAEALYNIGRRSEAVKVLTGSLGEKDQWVRLHALNVIDRLDAETRKEFLPQVSQLDAKGEYTGRVIRHLLGQR